MRFDEKYPKVDIWSEPEQSLIKVDESKKCFECGILTPWFEMDLDVHICSDECREKAYKEYNSK